MTSIPVLGMAKKPSNETQKLTLRSSRFPFFFFFAFLILLPSFYRIHRTFRFLFVRDVEEENEDLKKTTKK